MNEKKYLSYLEQYHQWLTDRQGKTKEELAEREAYAKEMQKYDKKRLLGMTAEDVYNLLSPLWAMAMWGNKHYKIDNLIETNSLELIICSMERIRLPSVGMSSARRSKALALGS